MPTQIQTTIEVDATLKATLAEGELRVVLTVAAPYGPDFPGRKAGVSVEEFDPGLLAAARSALQALADSQIAKAANRAVRAAHEAAAVAARHGEGA
mgnify:CR=1 FL=1